MADALGGILDVGQKAAHGFAMMGSPGYRAGQIAQSDIEYKKSLGKQRDINTVLSRIRMAGGLETEAGRRIAQTELMNNPELIRLMESINPYRGFSPEQEMKARLYERGVTSRPGARPYEAGDLTPEQDRKYREALRRGKLESFKPAWERDFPDEPTGGAFGGITPPVVPPETPPFRTTTQEELLPRRTPPQPTGADILRKRVKSPEPTEAQINSTLEDLGKEERMAVFQESMKLKSIWSRITTEEKITIYQKLAEGFTADEIIKHYKRQQKPWEVP